MATANSTFITTPATMTINRCQAGFDRNSSGFGGAAICSVSMLSSIIPAIFT